jgi:hypothetical protein
VAQQGDAGVLVHNRVIVERKQKRQEIAHMVQVMMAEKNTL